MMTYANAPATGFSVSTVVRIGDRHPRLPHLSGTLVKSSFVKDNICQTDAAADGISLQVAEAKT